MPNTDAARAITISAFLTDVFLSDFICDMTVLPVSLSDNLITVKFSEYSQRAVLLTVRTAIDPCDSIIFDHEHHFPGIRVFAI